MRQCPKCLQDRAEDDFYSKTTCWDCRRKYKREWQAAQYKKDPEGVKARHRAGLAKRRAEDPDRFKEYEVKLIEYQKQYRQDHREEQSARHLQKKRKLQAETTESATRHGAFWAGWELEMISDPDRTARDLAKELGRTYIAVHTMRQRIREEPAVSHRAGLGDVL